MAATVGLAPRVRVATLAPPALVEAEQEEEVEDELQKQEAKARLVARLLEFGGTTQLSSMRAIMATAVLKAINS